MTVETFFANFGHLADAPNGVQKLRELILQLAVQGKLVPQDQNDEPASVLIEGCKKEQARLVKEKVIRKPKPLSPLTQEEVVYELPTGWLWSKLGNLGVIFNGNSVNATQKAKYSRVIEGLPFIATKDVGYGSLDIDYKNGVVIPFDVPGMKVAHSNTVLICAEGGSAGRKIGLIDRDIYFGNKLFANETFSVILPKYIFYVYQCPAFASAFREQMTGIIGGISLQSFLNLPVPLPPLEEQKRIVAKIEQLMTLCDELEARQQKQQQGRVRLNNAALDALLTAREPIEFADHWQRISTNFDLLYDHPETIAKLRAAILQLAVQGKLVPQDPNDEPASVLLGRIKAERQASGFSADIKSGNLDLLSDVRKSVRFPPKWDVMELADVVLAIVDCPHSTPKWTTNGKLCVRTNQFKPGRLNLTDSRYVSKQTYETRVERLKPQADDILYSREGGILGVACRVPENVELCLGQRMMLFRPSSCCIPEFLELVLNSPVITEIAREQTTGGAAPRVNVSTVKSYPIPVPPLNEQKRIVDKVDQLMTLCGELEAKLNQSQQHSGKLMEATVRQLLVA